MFGAITQYSLAGNCPFQATRKLKAWGKYIILQGAQILEYERPVFQIISLLTE